MGPLFPEPNLNLILAIVIGFFFGFLLEQAGFSTSKKLVGLFYGYDFTVWRVFFTAAVTAMFGVLLLSYLDLLDLDLIYINPLYLWSIVVGGILMGFGFIMGGFCPGTSICATFIGKIDALVFVIGVALGILIFIFGYPAFVDIYKGSYLGIPQIHDFFGMSMGAFAFLIIIIAFLSYWGVNAVERKINGGNSVDPTSKSALVKITAVAFIVAFTALFMYPRKQALLNEYKTKEFAENVKAQTMDADELALRLVMKDPKLQLIDLRSADEYKKETLPYALNVKPKDFWSDNIKNALNRYDKQVVFFANDETDELKAYHLAQELGFDTSSYYILKGGYKTFAKEILAFVPPAREPKTRAERDTWRFRAYAAKELPAIIKEAKPKKVVIPKVKRALGGCG